MKNKKKACFLAGIIAAMLMTSLTGCGGNKTQTPEPPQTEQTESENQGESEAASETEIPSEAPAVDENLFVFSRDNFPKMDGSTSLAPLGRAIASVMLGESTEEVEDLISFNKTTQSYRNLMNGECDLILASEPNAVVFDEMKENGFEMDIEEISTEALVFVVNVNNPIESLTTDQIRDIYTGKITNWKEVGGEDLKIEAFQRNSGSGSQALMDKLIMKDQKMVEGPDDYVISGMGELMTAVKGFDNTSAALGYSVYYYANDMRMAEGLKIIQVDGVEPSDETIRSGKYPHTNAYFCAISKAAEAGSPERMLYDWVVSDEGQRLVAAEGYVSVKDVQ